MSTYAEKAAAYQTPSGYAVQGGYDAQADYYRQQAYVGQAYPQGYTAQTYTAAPQYMMPQQGMYGYQVQQDSQLAGRMSSFNAAAPPPNFSRPPPGQMGKDDYQNAALAHYDSSAQSSAAYTASWVSSTSSIRPDMPEGGAGLPQMVGDFGQWNNPDQGGDSGVTSGGSNPYGQAIEQFSKMTVNDQQGYEHSHGAWGQIELQAQHNAGLNNQAQWPGLDQAGERMNKEKKREEREKRQREEAPAKDLTWEERLKRAQGAKERAENPRFEKRGEEADRGRGRGRGGFRGGLPGRGPRSEQGDEGNRDNRYNNGQRRPMQNGEAEFSNQMRGGMRGAMPARGGLAGMGAMQQGVMPQTVQQMPMYRGVPPPQGLMAGPPPHYLPPGATMPPMMAAQQQQDQKFRNSWLDANLFGGFPMPFPPMDYHQMSSMMRGRGRGRGGMSSRGRGGRYRPEERDGDENTDNGEERFGDEASENSQNVEDKEENIAQENKSTQDANVD